MSHKNRHNYTNYSKPQQTAPVVEPEVKVEEVVETVTVEESVAAPVVEPVAPTPEPSVEPENTEFLGVVADCAKLNVRKEPSINAVIVTEITSGTEVMVNKSESTDEFYKVVTGAGVEGYCMKKFISI